PRRSSRRRAAPKKGPQRRQPPPGRRRSSLDLTSEHSFGRGARSCPPARILAAALRGVRSEGEWRRAPGEAEGERPRGQRSRSSGDGGAVAARCAKSGRLPIGLGDPHLELGQPPVESGTQGSKKQRERQRK